MKRLDKGNEARRAARIKAAKPGATRRIEDKRKDGLCTCDKPQLRCPQHDQGFDDIEFEY